MILELNYKDGRTDIFSTVQRVSEQDFRRKGKFVSFSYIDPTGRLSISRTVAMDELTTYRIDDETFPSKYEEGT